MNKPIARLAVIMPAYNAAQYIESSVSCVLNQSYRELELIVVDDGSTDDTPAILSRLAEQDSRLRPISVPNAGPAMARNRGLAALAPETEYVMFADADDQLLHDAAEYAMSAAEAADMVFFGFSIINPDGSRRDYFEPEQLLDRETLKASFGRLYKANLFNQVWGKLFRRELLEGLSFKDYRWGEDRLFIYDCLEKAEKLQILPQCKYRYIMHPGESLISKFLPAKPHICLESDVRVEALCRSLGCDEATEADCRYMFAKSIFSCMTTLFSSGCKLSPGEKRLYVKEIISMPRVQQRCRACFGGLAPNLLCALLRSRIVWLNLRAFRALALVGQLSPRLFTKLKHRK